MDIWEKKVKKSDKICVNGVLDWWFGILGSQKIEKIYSCWIHAGFMHVPQRGLKSHFFNEKSKQLIQTAAENLENFGNFGINLGCRMVFNSCWIHSGVMLNSCIIKHETL